MLEHFDTPFAIYSASEEEFASFSQMRASTVNALGDKRLDDAYAVLDACAVGQIGVLTYGDEAYPQRLKQLKDSPVVLYYRGRLPDFDSRLCLAVVGTRSMTEYGKQSAFRLSRDVAQAGGIVVSGMARGIDGVAACGA
ncbi:MAG: DNA-processing protein DprA, partial [Clostridia bacterium]|nr:DNA-processing protein DprA [Clostridia bacterium]